MAGNTEVRRSKGLKDHKKAQKAKVAEKRAAAAAAAKSKKSSKVEMKAEPVVSTELVVENVAQESVSSRVEQVVQEEPAGDMSGVHHVTMVEQETTAIAYKLQELASENIVIPNIIISKIPIKINVVIAHDLGSIEYISAASMAPADEVMNLKAHRKALEADLYANMESPKERFARINRIASATAEYHEDVIDIEDYDSFGDTLAVTAERAIDSNGFESVAARDVAPADDLSNASPEIVATEPANIHIDEDVNEHVKDFAPLALNELFSKAAQTSTHDILCSKAAKTGAPAVGASCTKASISLQGIEEQQKGVSVSPSISIGQLFAAVEAEGTTVVRMATATQSSPSQSVVQLCSAAKVEDPPVVDLPAAARNCAVCTNRRQAWVDAGLKLRCKDEILVGLFLNDPAIISTKVAGGPIETRELSEAALPSCNSTAWGFADVSAADAEEEVLPVSDAQLQQDLEAGSEKLMAMLGVVNRSPPASPKDSIAIQGLFAASRSRAASGSSAYTDPASSAGESGYYTPDTHKSASPQPMYNECAPQKWNGHNFAANGYDPTWSQDTSAFYPPPHGFQHPGFGPGPFFPEQLYGPAQYNHFGSPVFHDFVPGQKQAQGY